MLVPGGHLSVSGMSVYSRMTSGSSRKKITSRIQNQAATGVCT